MPRKPEAIAPAPCLGVTLERPATLHRVFYLYELAPRLVVTHWRANRESFDSFQRWW